MEMEVAKDQEAKRSQVALQMVLNPISIVERNAKALDRVLHSITMKRVEDVNL